MKWALVNSENIVLNVIAWDGSAPFNPPAGQSVVQVNDWIDLGNHISEPEKVGVPPTKDEEKTARVAKLKDDLTMIACFDIERKSNPDLKFEAYIDSLEQKQQAIIADSAAVVP